MKKNFLFLSLYFALFHVTITCATDYHLGSDLLFEDFSNQIFNLQDISPLTDMGNLIPVTLLPDYNIPLEYVKYQESSVKPISENLDIGAFENTSSLSVNDETLNTILVYPNPIKDILTIDNKGELIKNCKIYNTIGQVVQSNSSFDDNKIDISSLTSGVYLIKFISNQKKITVKFITYETTTSKIQTIFIGNNSFNDFYF
ncbi:MAG: T9SS type A sorting domain-containing protein [Flavobacteriaceae bacterium]|nr:T9SS type A sorting domain-containing protein [Flavobacteriaceae bacterium]